MTERFACAAAIIACCLGCAAAQPPTTPAPTPPTPAVGPPTAQRRQSVPSVMLSGGTVLTAAGKRIDNGHVLLVDGRIKAVGEGEGNLPPGATRIDVRGRFITPGLIDTHSHMGVYPLPESDGNDDGNEATNPVTAEVSAQDGFWPQDPALPRAIASGITTIQVLPGSANLIGGQSFVAKLHLRESAAAMRFVEAPIGLKMACGENPKRVYGKGGHRSPSTRMGNIAGFRRAFEDAKVYQQRKAKHQRELDRYNNTSHNSDDEPPEAFARDFALEALVGVLEGRVLVHNHCYRADEMHTMLDLAHDYGFRIRSFHHALEAYKLADRLAAEQVAVSTWADWWGFKMEAYDGIPHNAALVAHAGGRAIIHSDSQTEIRHLNHEVGKAIAAGRELGIAISEDDALAMITRNPAWALGVLDHTGTIEAGKMADVVVWDSHPFSVYAKATDVFIDGEHVFARGTRTPSTDFEVMNTQPVVEQR